tara:strand:- start:1144 stop:1314 length:171 start_codon:yes stop_codon:yes gene_type:complete
MNIFRVYRTKPTKSTFAIADYLSGKEKIKELLKPPSKNYYHKFGLTDNGEEFYAAG